MEKFLDKILTKNRTNAAQEKSPLIYKEMIQVADATVMNFNGWQSELWRKLRPAVP